MAETTLEDRFESADRIRDFTLPESRALIDLAFLMIMVDRKVTDVELGTLRDQLERLPFANKQQADRALSDHIDRARQTAANIVEDEEARRAFIEGATQRIPGRNDREFVLEFLSLLSAADDYHDAETQTWVEIAEAFNLEADELPDYWAAETAQL